MLCKSQAVKKRGRFIAGRFVGAERLLVQHACMSETDAVLLSAMLSVAIACAQAAHKHELLNSIAGNGPSDTSYSTQFPFLKKTKQKPIVR